MIKIIKQRRYIIWVTLVVFTLCLFSPVSVMAASTATTASTLTIDQALDEAYNNNSDLQKVQLQLESKQDLRDDASEAIDYIPTGGLLSTSVQAVVNAYQQADIALAAAKKSASAAKSSVTYDVVSAYNDVVTAYNDVESARISLDEAKEQKRIASLSKELGIVSEVDYDKLNDDITASEDGLKALEEQYKTKVSALAVLLGKGADWQPNLSSRATLAEYPRDDLSVETHRCLDQSILILQAQAEYDIEKSKQDWILVGTTSNEQNRNVAIAGIDLKQAQDDARSTIEQLYYGINAKESEIKVNRNALEQAEKDLKIGELKYSLGLIPKVTLSVTEDSITSLRNDVAKARMDLENSCADLATLKANFAYVTGKTVFENADWKTN